METTITTTIVEEAANTTTTRTLKYTYPEGLTPAQKKAFRRQARRNEQKIQKMLASFTEPILPLEAEELEEVTYLLPEAP